MFLSYRIERKRNIISVFPRAFQTKENVFNGYVRLKSNDVGHHCHNKQHDNRNKRQYTQKNFFHIDLDALTLFLSTLSI